MKKRPMKRMKSLEINFPEKYGDIHNHKRSRSTKSGGLKGKAPRLAKSHHQVSKQNIEQTNK